MQLDVETKLRSMHDVFRQPLNLHTEVAKKSFDNHPSREVDIPDSRFQVPDSRFQISDSRLVEYNGVTL